MLLLPALLHVVIGDTANCAIIPFSDITSCTFSLVLEIPANSMENGQAAILLLWLAAVQQSEEVASYATG